MKIIINRMKNQAGQAFILVLILLAVGGIILTPLLYYVSSGLNAEEIYASKTKDYHAADSGVEDALWQIKYDHLDEKFISPAYDKYNYDIFGASYAYPESLDVNDRDVNVIISNLWIPIIDPDPVEQGLSRFDMRSIIETGKVRDAYVEAVVASLKAIGKAHKN